MEGMELVSLFYQQSLPFISLNTTLDKDTCWVYKKVMPIYLSGFDQSSNFQPPLSLAFHTFFPSTQGAYLVSNILHRLFDHH